MVQAYIKYIHEQKWGKKAAKEILINRLHVVLLNDTFVEIFLGDHAFQ